ncbi:MAG: leucine-rich repeat domain-containing protein [Clostridia bacterium]|nr:leucine-rich repeat domain-containing protein [Clostridia bacterium]
MKKVVSLLCVIALMLSLAALSGCGQTKGLTFTLISEFMQLPEAQGYTLTEQYAGDGDAYVCAVGPEAGETTVVPAEYKHLPVRVVIGTPEGLGNVKELTVSEGVLAIENLALYDGKGEEPASDETVLTDGWEYSMEDQTDIADAASEDGQTSGKNVALETVSLPGSVKQIRNSFVNCANLKNVEIKGDPEAIRGSFRQCGTETISFEKLSGDVAYSFRELASLTGITFGEISQPDIKKTSFKLLPALDKLEFTGKVDFIGPVAEDVEDDGGEVASTKNTELFKYHDTLREVAFRGEVVSLPESFCDSCENLTSVVFEKPVGYIGESCFDFCDELSTLKFEDKVGIISDSCFTAGKLTELTFGGDVGRIGNHEIGSFTTCAFAYNDELEKVVFNGSVEELNNCFDGCDGLESAVWEGSLGSVYGSFNKCGSLKTLNFKGYVYALEDSFSDSGELETVTFAGELSRLEGSVFSSSDKVELVNVPEGVEYGTEELSQRFDPAQQKLRGYYDLVNKYGGNLTNGDLVHWVLEHVAGKTLAAGKQIDIGKAKSYAKDLNGPLVYNFDCTDCAYDDYGPKAAKENPYYVKKITDIKKDHPDTVFTEEKALKVAEGKAPLVIGVAESMGYLPIEYTATDGSGVKETLYHEMLRVSLWNIETGELIAWYKYKQGEAPTTYQSNRRGDYASLTEFYDSGRKLWILKGKYNYPEQLLWETIFPES